MAAVYLGRLLGPAGFSRTVAIKRLHPHLASDPSFVAMLLDEARLAGRIQHPNVAATIDVVAKEGELFVVMEYLHGESLSKLAKLAKSREESIPVNIAVAIAASSLHGLHAAHEVRGEGGDPLGIVHRDVSPQNIMVRRDGSVAVVDFGVAKAAGRFQTTQEGQVKGKLPYMAPEQVRGGEMTRRVDVYAAFAVLWEMLVGRRLFKGENEGEVLEQLLFGTVAAPGTLVSGIPPALDAAVMRGLERDPSKRFQTAREAAIALEDALAPELPSRISAWIESLAGEALDQRAERVVAMESGSLDTRGDLQSFLGTPDAAAVPAPPADDPSAVRPARASAPVEGDERTAQSFVRPPKAARPSRERVVLLVGVLALAGAALLFFLPSRASREMPAAQASASAPLPAAASADDARPPAAPSTPASASASAPPAKSAPPPPGRTVKPRADCAVPYTLDANGRKTYRRECL